MQKYAYSIHETAEALGLGRSKLYELLQSGEIPTFYVGRKRLVAADDLQRFVESRREQEKAA